MDSATYEQACGAIANWLTSVLFPKRPEQTTGWETVSEAINLSSGALPTQALIARLIRARRRPWQMVLAHDAYRVGGNMSQGVLFAVIPTREAQGLNLGAELQVYVPSARLVLFGLTTVVAQPLPTAHNFAKRLAEIREFRSYYADYENFLRNRSAVLRLVYQKLRDIHGGRPTNISPTIWQTVGTQLTSMSNLPCPDSPRIRQQASNIGACEMELKFVADVLGLDFNSLATQAEASLKA